VLEKVNDIGNEAQPEMASWKNYFKPEVFSLLINCMGIRAIGSLVKIP
jgi:hypothetical protein